MQRWREKCDQELRRAQIEDRKNAASSEGGGGRSGGERDVGTEASADEGSSEHLGNPIAIEMGEGKEKEKERGMTGECGEKDKMLFGNACARGVGLETADEDMLRFLSLRRELMWSFFLHFRSLGSVERKGSGMEGKGEGDMEAPDRRRRKQRGKHRSRRRVRKGVEGQREEKKEDDEVGEKGEGEEEAEKEEEGKTEAERKEEEDEEDEEEEKNKRCPLAGEEVVTLVATLTTMCALGGMLGGENGGNTVMRNSRAVAWLSRQLLVREIRVQICAGVGVPSEMLPDVLAKQMSLIAIRVLECVVGVEIDEILKGRGQRGEKEEGKKRRDAGTAQEEVESVVMVEKEEEEENTKEIKESIGGGGGGGNGGRGRVLVGGGGKGGSLFGADGPSEDDLRLHMRRWCRADFPGWVWMEFLGCFVFWKTQGRVVDLGVCLTTPVLAVADHLEQKGQYLVRRVVEAGTGSGAVERAKKRKGM
jgi:hypothetical protein